MEIRKIQRAIILFIAEGSYAGRMPFAPGTAGTLVGVFLYLLINRLPLTWYVFVSILTVGVGTWASGEAEKLLQKKDAPSIVIDEIAGYLVSMALVPCTWGFVLAGFILFRFFDILKPWPLKKLQDIRGGAGVMLDDIGAGLYTNILLQILSTY
jgi:phosphatidylglycerophosphatase A